MPQLNLTKSYCQKSSVRNITEILFFKSKMSKMIAHKSYKETQSRGIF